MQTSRHTAATSYHIETCGIPRDVINVRLGSHVAEADPLAAKGRSPAAVLL